MSITGNAFIPMCSHFPILIMETGWDRENLRLAITVKIHNLINAQFKGIVLIHIKYGLC